jgi:heptosyltransferase II
LTLPQHHPTSTTSGGVLIIQTAFIGDTILAAACIEHIRNQHPHMPIDLMVRKGNEGLYQGHPHLGILYVWNKRSSKYPQLLRFIAAFRKRRYDWCINLQKHPTTALVTLLSGARRTAGFTTTRLSRFYSHPVEHRFDTARQCTHEVDLLLRVTAGIAPVTGRVLPRLYPSDADRTATSVAGPYVTIAPASVRFTKQYPSEKWLAVIALLPQHYTIVLIGGGTDRQLCETIRKQSGNPKVITRAGELSYLQSAALMQRAAMNFVNDSAPLHIASSVGAPVTAVFCSTVPAFGFGPLGANGRLVETAAILPCRPCGLHGHRSCPEGHFKCADIPPENVVAVPGW